MKKKFTQAENAKRRAVFEYNRNRQTEGGYKYYESCTKKFGRSKLVINAIRESNKRIEYCQPTPSIREIVRFKVQNHCNEFASSLPDSGYSMGEEKYIYCKYLDVVSYDDHTREYAKSCRWKAIHGEVQITMPIRLLMSLENMSGVLTIRGKQIQNRIWKCKWIEFDYQRNGHGIIKGDIGYHLIDGYVVYRRCVEHYPEGWFHSDSIADARQMLKEYLSDEKRDAAHKKEQMRQYALNKKAKEKEEREFSRLLKRVEKKKEMKNALSHLYTYRDSIIAGNCIPGTDSFLKNHNLQKTEKRSGEFLLRISKKTVQHNNVIRILCKYLSDTYPDFYNTYVKVINAILKNI